MNKVPSQPVDIVLDDLSLRQISESDVDVVVVALTDPMIARWNPVRIDGLDPREGVLTWIRRRNDWSSSTHASWGVFNQAGNQLLGAIDLHRIDPMQGNAEIGYWTVVHARGNGVASRAVIAATRFAFQTLGLYRLQLTHAVENVASCRVAHKAGFRAEGVLRQSLIYGDGERHDEHLHARLRTDPAPNDTDPH